MVIVKLQGGLGNQMFQYAAAHALAGDKPVYINLSFLKKNKQSTAGFTAREYELNLFKNIKVRPLSARSTQIINSKNKFYRLLKRLLFPGIQVIYDDNIYSVKPGKNVYLDGYFQDENIFKQHRGELLKQLAFPLLPATALTWEQQIVNADSPVGIHVRRGDYLKPDAIKYHGVLPIAYYQQAIELINSKVINPQYFIFSDDQDWCRTSFSFLKNAYFVETHNQAWADMALMSRCKHHIIANSSFSWWGAWLNTFTEKITIAPKAWFSENNNHHIIPDSWISI